MHNRRIGDIEVSAIGLGGMPMSIEGRPDEARSLATIHAALDAGVTLIDTADAYHRDADEVGHNETLIAKALASHDRGGDVLVATKGGHLRPGDGSWTLDGSPRPPQGGLRGVAAPARRGGHRPLPVPPPRPEGAVRRVRRRGAGPARRGQDPHGGHLQRRPGPDQAGQRDPRRPAGLRAEPVLPGLPLQRAGTATCATSSASRSCPGARWAASPGPVNWAPPTRRSPGSPRPTG